MAENNIIKMLVVVVLFAAFIGLIADQATNVNTLGVYADTTTVPATVPLNVSLTNNYSNIVSLTNGSLTLSTGNYTLHSADTSVIQIDDNTSWTNTLTINYNYQQSGYVRSGAARILIGLIALIFAIGIIVSIATGKEVKVK